jgi:hypothetical protein
MNPPTDPHHLEQRIDAILRDRQKLRTTYLPRVIAKAEQVYPPSLQRSINAHRIAVDEARLYAAGMGTSTIGELRGRSRQLVDQAVIALARRYFLSYPELLERDEAV